MRIGQIVTGLSVFLALALGWGAQSVQAQQLRIETGGGWAIPSSDVSMTGTLEGQEGRVSVDPGSGYHVYGAVRLSWTVSDNFDLEGRLRVQHSRMPGDTEDFENALACPDCTFSNDPDGRVRGATVEGQITLTSVGRINPYFLVGLGVVRTSVDAVLLTGPQGTEISFSEVEVIDAGGDVGFGATMPLFGDLLLAGEIRASGSLPGAKENAVSVFPFSLGLSYGF